MYERLIARDISPTQAINQELQVSCSSLGKVEFELSNFGVECIQRRLQWILEMDIGQDFIYRLTFFSVYHICVCLSMPVPRTEVVVLATVMAASTEKQPVEDRNLDRSGKSWTTRFFFYDQKQIKSAENKRRVLGVFIQKLISVRSGQGLQPTSSLSPCQLYNL